MECRLICNLHCLFESPPDFCRFSHLTDLLKTVKHKDFDAGQHVFVRGEEPGGIVSIRSGLLKLVDYSASGTERILLLAGRGNAVGLEGLLDQPMQHDAIAIRPTSICWVPSALLQQLALRDSALHRQLMSFWKDSLSFAERSLAGFSVGPTPARIARLILFRAAIEKSRNSSEITLLSRQDMAAILGVSPENVSRAIAQFRRDKLLRKLRRDVYLCDMDSIRTVAEG